MTARKLKHSLILLSVVGFVAVLAMQGGSSAATDHDDSVEGQYKDTGGVYATIEEAQQHVPFRLLTFSEVPEGFSLTGIAVFSHAALDLGRDVTIVEMTYRAPGAQFLSVIQRDAPYNFPETAVPTERPHEEPTLVETERNLEGTQIGTVYASRGDLAIVIRQTHVDADTVVGYVERLR